MTVALNMWTASPESSGTNFGSTQVASKSASRIGNYLLDIATQPSRSVLASRRFDAVFEQIMVAYAESSESNWGGYNELPIRAESIRDACQFLFLLPAHLQNFDVFGEPDGALAVEWRNSAFESIILSFQGGGIVHFSNLRGPTSHLSGSFRLQGTIPIHVVRLIKEVVES